MVALIYKGEPNFTGQFCGASLIKADWIVTAAHCVIDENKYTFVAVQGIYDLDYDTGQRVGVKRIIIHPKYNDCPPEFMDCMDYDVALVQLNKPIKNAVPISLLQGTPNLIGVTATVVGWGNTSSEGYDDYPYWLQEVQVPIISNSLCRTTYENKSLSERLLITSNMLCAGYAEGGQDSCQGDSGGPLMVWQNNQYRLAGVVSSGDGCAQPYAYGVYTRISRVTGFINNYIK
jgi:secreted trypsin-like serine protease